MWRWLAVNLSRTGWWMGEDVEIGISIGRHWRHLKCFASDARLISLKRTKKIFTLTLQAETQVPSGALEQLLGKLWVDSFIAHRFVSCGCGRFLNTSDKSVVMNARSCQSCKKQRGKDQNGCLLPLHLGFLCPERIWAWASPSHWKYEKVLNGWCCRFCGGLLAASPGRSGSELPAFWGLYQFLDGMDLGWSILHKSIEGSEFRSNGCRMVNPTIFMVGEAQGFCGCLVLEYLCFAQNNIGIQWWTSELADSYLHIHWLHVPGPPCHGMILPIRHTHRREWGR